MSVIAKNIEKQLDLIDLAARINQEHRLAEASARSAIEHAIAAGRMLVEAKARCKHGGWIPWIEEHCEFSESTARRYMRIANHIPQLESKRSRVTDLSIRAAAAMLAEPREAEEEEPEEEEPEEEEPEEEEPEEEEPEEEEPEEEEPEEEEPEEEEPDKFSMLLAEWQKADDDVVSDILNRPAQTKFNRQDTTSIEWAQWSWNPITGCRHDCPYCYARDIANRFYPQKFEPAIYPGRLWAPQNTNVPYRARQDIAFKNVFTCSMADLFGRWVPIEWINLVMDEVRNNKQWNFLFLTKFPQRFKELDDLPKNAWMGTTVDCQDRVANAEKAFAKVEHGTKWVSIEPMLTPIKFKRLDLFDWVVIGGASSSSKTPSWTPPLDWVFDLHRQAREAGCKIYYKTNAGMSDDLRVREFPWTKSAEKKLPTELSYLGMKQ